MSKLYYDLYRDISRKIALNILKPGEKISERSYANKYQVSRTTVINAFNILKSMGVLESRHKSGTFISDKIVSVIDSPFDFLKEHSIYDNDISTNNLIDFTKRYFNDKEFNLDSYYLKSFNNFLKNFESVTSKGNCSKKGSLNLRLAIRDMLSSRGIFCTVDQIVTFPSASSAISTLFNIFSNYKANIYTSELSSLRFYKSVPKDNISIIPLVYDNEGINLQDMENKYQLGHNMLYINPNYSYPIPNSISIKRYKCLLDMIKYYKIGIIEDDTIFDFSIDTNNSSFKHYQNNNFSIYIGSISHFSNLFDSGWLVLPEELVDLVAGYKQRFIGSGYNIYEDLIGCFICNEFKGMLEEIVRISNYRNDIINSTIKRLFPSNIERSIKRNIYNIFIPDIGVNSKIVSNELLKRGLIIGVVNDMPSYSNAIYINHTSHSLDNILLLLEILSTFIDRY